MILQVNSFKKLKPIHCTNKPCFIINLKLYVYKHINKIKCFGKLMLLFDQKYNSVDLN